MDRKRFKEIRFSKSELYKLIIVSFVIGFMFSFRSWGAEEFSLIKGVMNLILFSLFSFLALIIHFTGEKYYGARRGLDVEYKPSYPGLGVGLYVTFLTNGFFFIPAPGTFKSKWKRKQRVGLFRYRVYIADYGYAVMVGILANILMASILMPFKNYSLIYDFARINVLIAIFSLIPLPQFDGLYQFVGSFYQYAFTIGLVAGFSSLFFFSLNPLYGLMGGLLFGIGGMWYVFNKDIS